MSETYQGERLMAPRAQMQQPHQREEVADMQRRRGRIDAGVHCRRRLELFPEVGAGVSDVSGAVATRAGGEGAGGWGAERGGERAR